MSTPLKHALTDAGLTPERFAEIIGVDPKSVHRWSTGPTIPYPRHRTKIAQALGLPIEDLWPNLTAKGNRGSDPDGDIASGREVVAAVAVVGEVLAIWASPGDPGAPDPETFVVTHPGPVDMIAPFDVLVLPRTLIDALRDRARAGEPVRLLGAPDPRCPIPEHPNIHIRTPARPSSHTLIRAGQHLLYNPHLNQPHHAGPLLHITHQADDGIYDRLTTDFEHLWEQAAAAGTEQIGTQENNKSLERAGEQNSEPEPSPVQTRPVGPAGASTTTTPRRWPRRPPH